MFSSTSSLVAAAYTLFAAVSASPDAFPFTNEPAHQLVNRADVIITTGATGDVHPRLEIGNLATRDDQWALYIQTMNKWQQAGEDETSGYYGVASIHGVPLEDWNGATQCDSCGTATGYGTHDMIIFPTWHRLYLCHFEQMFLDAALEVALSYPAESRERMVAAHKTLRLPFWDWAAEPETNSSCLPETISSPQITINGPNGIETVSNPLYSFQFSEAETKANYYSVFTTWLQTYRYPTSDTVDATSEDSAAVSALDGMQTSLKDQVYQMLTACDDYLHFSNDQVGATSKCANSLEQIHNTVHTLAGGAGSESTTGGHLTYLPLSTYDPIFWLHHANVDRLFALWQIINPDSFLPTQTAPHATWVIPSGATLNGDYPLSPFNKDSSSYWTSNDIRDWTVLGYTYPEFTTSDGQKSDIATYINGLYGNKATLRAGDISAQVPATQVNTTTPPKSPSTTRGDNSTGGGLLGGIIGGVKLNLTTPSYSKPSGLLGLGNGIGKGIAGGIAELPGLGHGIGKGVAGGIAELPGLANGVGKGIGGGITDLLDTIKNGVEDLMESFIDAATGNAYEYVCNIQTPRYALNGSYYVYVFNGAPGSDSPASWLQDENLIGMMGVLASPAAMPGHDMLVTGQIPLTRSLRSLVTLGSLLGMSEDNILPFLTKNLEWRIAKNGQEIDVDSVEGFKASVYSSQASVPKSVGELPSYNKFAPQVDVTKGKTGGASKAIFGEADDDSNDSVNAPSYGSGSSSAATYEATKTATKEASKTDVPSYGSASSAPTYAASSAPIYEASSAPTYEASSSAPGAYSYGSYTPSASASPFKSLDTPASYATAPAGAIPSAYESWATVSQPAAETCAIVTTTVKHVETIYITESPTPSATAPVYSAPPVPVYPVPSAPVYNTTSVVTVVPIPSSPVETSPVSPSAPAEYPSESKTVPVAPYPVPSKSQPAYYPTGSGSPVVPVYPTGTGKVFPSSPVPYTGAASALNVAGLFAGIGALVAFFM